jgi:hypothetical protein
MNFAVSGRQRALGSSEQAAGVTSIIAKGFGICVRRNAAKVTAGWIHAATLCVWKMLRHSFPSNHRTFTEKE